MKVKTFVIGMALGITAGVVLANCPPVKKLLTEGKKRLKKMAIDCE